MASGTLYGDSNQGSYAYIEWSSSIEPDKNRSHVVGSLCIHIGRKVWEHDPAVECGLRVGDNVLITTKEMDKWDPGDHNVFELDTYIDHDDNGYAQINFEGYFNIDVKWSYYVGTLNTGYRTVELDRIDRSPVSIYNYSILSKQNDSKDTVKLSSRAYHTHGFKRYYTILHDRWYYAGDDDSDITITGLTPNTEYYPQLHFVSGSGIGNVTQCLYYKTAIEPVTSITIEAQKNVITEGDKLQLSCIVKPDNASIKNIKYSSSNTNIATVNEAGVVTGISNGQVTITANTAYTSEVSAKIVITVESMIKSINVPLKSFKLSKNSKYHIIYSIDPKNAANKKVIFKVYKRNNDNIYTLINDGYTLNENVIVFSETGNYKIKIISDAKNTIYTDIECVVVETATWKPLAFDPVYLNFDLVDTIYNNLNYFLGKLLGDNQPGIADIVLDYALDIDKTLVALNNVERKIDSVNELLAWENIYYQCSKTFNKDSVLSKTDVMRWINFCEECESVLNKSKKIYKKLLVNNNTTMAYLKDSNSKQIMIGDDKFGKC